MSENIQLHGPINPYPNITELIEQDVRNISEKLMRDFHIIRAYNSIYTFKCLFDGNPAVAKYFVNEEDRREILNYRVLTQYSIPTVKTFVLGKATIVMEDVTKSDVWRLGKPYDVNDVDVSKVLAEWYFTLHERGSAVLELDSLYFEYDSITEEALNILIEKLPNAKELFNFILSHYSKLRELIFKPSFTLTYNDFNYTNFAVRRDKKAAMMFDYNLLGKGYRFSDFRNVCWPMDNEARKVFISEYRRLYIEKHGHYRADEEKVEENIDDVVSHIFTLYVAYTKRDHFPDWARDSEREAINGNLLAKTKLLLL